jgi:hypothetical protein
MAMHTGQSRDNYAHLKNRPKNRDGALGLDAPEFTDTVSPAPTRTDDDEDEKEENSAPPARALPFGGNLKTITPGPIRKG